MFTEISLDIVSSRKEILDKLKVPDGTEGYIIDGCTYVPVATPLNRFEKAINIIGAGITPRVSLVGITSINEELEESFTQSYDIGSEYKSRGIIELQNLPHVRVVENMRRRLTVREYNRIRDASGDGFVGVYD